MKKSIFMLAVASTTLLPLSVFAEEESNIVYIKRGQSQIITPTGFESSGIDTPISLSVITPEEIKASGAINVTEVLRSQVGVQFRNQSSDTNRGYVSMRGFGGNTANNVLIVIDGRKLNNPTLEAPNLNWVSLKDIERIEVIQGSGGVLYGDQAVGGVINIITKKIVSDRASISVTNGTDDLKQYTIEGAKRFDNGLNLRLSAESRTADNYRDSNEANYDDVFAKVNLVKEWGELYLERGYVSDKLNLPGALNTAQLQENPRQSVSSSVANDFVNLERFGAHFYINDNTIWQNDFSARDSNGVGFGNRKDTRVRTFHTKLLTQWDNNAGRVISTTGYEIIDNDYQSVITGANWQNKQNSVYTQLVYPLVKSVNLVAGARQTEVKDTNLSATTDDKRNSKQDETITEIGVNYQLGNTRYFLRRAEGVRFANSDENGFNLASVDFLLPQKSVSYESGIEFSNEKVRINATAYELKLDDELYYDAVLIANVNLDSSKRKGLILEVDYALTPNTAIGAGYNYINAEYTAGSYNGSTVPGVPSNSTKIYVDYQVSKGFRLFADAVYTGSRFLDNDYSNANDKLSAYTLVNANASWANGNSIVNLRINNLTSREYTTFHASYGAYPGAEREVQLTYTYNFK